MEGYYSSGIDCPKCGNWFSLEGGAPLGICPNCAAKEVQRLEALVEELQKQLKAVDTKKSVDEHLASHWRDDDSPQAESTFGVHVSEEAVCNRIDELLIELRFIGFAVAKEIATLQGRRSGTMTCPMCQQDLRFSIADNGHMAAQCSTEHCLTMRE